MLESILAWITAHATGIALFVGTPIVGAIVGLILKKFITEAAQERFGEGVRKIFFAIFRFITLTLNKATGGLWNKTVEPYFKLILDIFFKNAAIGSSEGLLSDNASKD